MTEFDIPKQDPKTVQVARMVGRERIVSWETPKDAYSILDYNPSAKILRRIGL